MEIDSDGTAGTTVCVVEIRANILIKSVRLDADSCEVWVVGAVGSKDVVGRVGARDVKRSAKACVAVDKFNRCFLSQRVNPLRPECERALRTTGSVIPSLADKTSRRFFACRTTICCISASCRIGFSTIGHGFMYII